MESLQSITDERQQWNSISRVLHQSPKQRRLLLFAKLKFSGGYLLLGCLSPKSCRMNHSWCRAGRDLQSACTERICTVLMRSLNLLQISNILYNKTSPEEDPMKCFAEQKQTVCKEGCRNYSISVWHLLQWSWSQVILLWCAVNLKRTNSSLHSLLSLVNVKWIIKGFLMGFTIMREVNTSLFAK